MDQVVTDNARVVYDFLVRFQFYDVKEGYMLRYLEEKQRWEDRDNWLVEHGYEEVFDAGEKMLYSDGREVVRSNRRTFVLNADEWKRRRELSFQLASNKSIDIPVEDKRGTVEALAESVCQCGGSINIASVCKACELGKLGYRFRYTCDSCDLDIVSKKEIMK